MPYPLRNCGPLRPKSLTKTRAAKRRVALPGVAMSNRSAQLVAAIFAGILTATSFAAVAEDSVKENSAKTADSCLSGPKGPVPAGGHWYYRVDRATKRNCWYIGEAKNKSARATPKDSTSAAASDPAASDPASQTANARSRRMRRRHHRLSYRVGRNHPASAHRAVRALPPPSHRKACRPQTHRPTQRRNPPFRRSRLRLRIHRRIDNRHRCRCCC
jgi:hypothetical protein